MDIKYIIIIIITEKGNTFKLLKTYFEADLFDFFLMMKGGRCQCFNFLYKSLCIAVENFMRIFFFFVEVVVLLYTNQQDYFKKGTFLISNIKNKTKAGLRLLKYILPIN